MRDFWTYFKLDQRGLVLGVCASIPQNDLNPTFAFMNLSMLPSLLLGTFLLTALPVALHADSVVGQVSKIQGSASITLPSGKTEPIYTGIQVPPGSTIRTAGDGTVSVHLCPGADTVFTPNTTVVITSLYYTKVSSEEANRKMRLNLKQGQCFFNLAHGGGTTDFKVKTPKGIAAARGTKGSIGVTVDGVEIKVTENAVVFTFPDGTTLKITAGNGVIITGRDGVRRYSLTAEDRRLFDQVFHDFLSALFNGGGFGNGGGQNGGGGGNLNPGNGNSNE
jgi:hypothetical protein